MIRLACLLIVMLAAGGALADDAAELEKLREENARLKARVAELEKQLGIVKQQKQQLAAEKEAIAQEQAAVESEQREYYLDREYNDEAGRTTITTRVSGLRTPRGGVLRHHWLRFEADYAGQPGSARPDTVLAKIETHASGKVYSRVDAVVFNTPHGPINAPVVDYDNKVRLSGGVRNRRRVDDEYISAKLTPRQISQLAAASEVSGKLGSEPFVLSREHIRILRALDKELGGS